MTEPFIRGIEARTLLAQANVQSVIHGADSHHYWDVLYEAINEAVIDGRHEYATHGYRDAPRLFAGEPLLVNAWKNGWAMARDMDEISHCSSCQAADGDPCPMHG